MGADFMITAKPVRMMIAECEARMKQMTIFDVLYPERINPLREVAKHASPYWTTSREKMIKFCNTDPDIDIWTKVVRHHYSPYGFAGHFGGSGTPNTMEGWTMRTDLILVTFWDGAGKHQELCFSWADFAREIADLIWQGEWDEDGCLDEECFGNHMNAPEGWDRYAELNGVEEEHEDD